MSRNTRHAVVIGGGLGGLSIALRLAVRGWRVTVWEQGPSFGGKMNRWTAAGFRFDTGPSLITMPWVFEELFAFAGVRMQDYLETAALAPVARYVYPDGTTFHYSTSMPELLPVIRGLEGNDRGFFEFMRLGARIYALSKDTFLRRPIGAPPDRKALGALRHAPVLRGWGNYQQTVNAYFRSAELRQLYGRYPTYVGSSPYRSPATLAIIPFIELVFGGWYIRGGLYRLVEALCGLLEARGVALRADSPVERIDTRGGRASGVVLRGGERLAADVVVMNGDTSRTDGLLGERAAEMPVDDRSLSGLVLLVGVKRRLEGLEHHNVYFSRDYTEEFRQLFDERRVPEDPTVYVNVPSRTEPSVAPAGGETLFLMVNAPATGETWDAARIGAARKSIFARLRASGFPEIQGDIVVEHAVTPQTLSDRFGMPGGAIYGHHSHGWRNAFFRPANRRRGCAGLYCVGGSAHPGGGTPMVLLSAKIVEELITRHEG